MKVQRHENGSILLTPQTEIDLGWLDQVAKSIDNKLVISFSSWVDCVLIPACREKADVNLEHIYHELEPKKYRRIMIRGCRQVGLSTMLAAIITYRLVTFEGQRIVIATPSASSYTQLVDKVLKFYNVISSWRDDRLPKLPWHVETDLGYSNVVFGNNNTISRFNEEAQLDKTRTTCFIADNFIHFGEEDGKRIMRKACEVVDNCESSIAVFASDMGTDSVDTEWFDKLFHTLRKEHSIWSCHTYPFYRRIELNDAVDIMLETAYPGFSRRWRCMTEYDIKPGEAKENDSEVCVGTCTCPTE